MNRKRILLLILVGCLMLPLAGCRVRTNSPGTESAAGGDFAAGTESRNGDSRDGLPDSAAQAEEEDTAEGEDADADGRTRENPDAVRKEFDENAAVEIEPGTDRPIHTEGEGSGTPNESEEADASSIRLGEEAEEPATRTVAAGEAEQMGVSEDAEAADSALTYYTVLLRDRLGSLYECQRVSLYWETDADHVTIHKSSPEHALILEAGAYDVSARLLPENLRVDDGWISRKNPDVIVKTVPRDILGPGVDSPSAAEPILQRLLSRESWTDITAVRGGKVLLLSGELLEAPWLQTAARLIIARFSYPSLFSDLDLSEALRLLSEESAGAALSGVYYYPEP